jgi:nucleoside-diphosphate-sugar epimerase
MKNILITGGNGYLGSVVAPFLTSKGFNCTVFDTGYFENCCLFTPENNFEIVKGDMRLFKESLLDNIDIVVHFSGISNDPLKGLNTKTFFDPTRDYSLELGRLCKKKGIKMIFASSCSVYGKGIPNQYLTERSKVNPQTPYSWNKIQIEQDLTKISDQNFSPILLRFATVFGLSPRLRFDLIINMLAGMAFTKRKIVLNSDGMAWRPVVHINDVAKVIELAINYEYKSDKPLVLNVGHNELNYKVIEIARIIQDLSPQCEIEFLSTNKKLSTTDDVIVDRKIQDGKDSRTYKVNFDKIHELFPHFTLEWTIEKGVKEMMDTFEKINLQQSQFESINYYRLQQMEHLLNSGLINKDLYWNI